MSLAMTNRRALREEYQRISEDICRDRVAAALAAEGRLVENMSTPDRDRRHVRPAPDFAFDLDGVRTALEVTGYVNSIVARASDAIVRLVTTFEAEARPTILARGLGWVGLSLAYIPELVPRAMAIDAASAPLRARVCEALDSATIPTARAEIDIEPTVSWIRRARLVLVHWPEHAPPPRLEVLHWPGPRDPNDRMSTFIASIVLDKADQVAAYSRAILGVNRDWWIAGADEIFDRIVGPLPEPWWRAYVVDRGRDAVLVYDRNDKR